VGAGVALAIVKASARSAARQHAHEPEASADPYSFVDPELVPAIKALPKVPISAETLVARRKSPPPVPPWPAPAPQLSEQRIPGPRGAPEVRLVMVDPVPGAKRRPVYLHIHGGGYVTGVAGNDPTYLQRIAQACNCLVVSVDYRLAPETRFPGSLEDNYAALRWLDTNAATIGVDRDRIAIGGESAGGGHAAALAIAARDRKEFRIAFQLLIYPMLDDRTGSSRSVPPHIGEFVWTAESNAFGWSSLLGMPAGSAKVPPGSVPARVDDLSGLPPAYIGVGAIDLLVGEDIEYARRLIDAGVPTELHVIPGAYHAPGAECGGQHPIH
jgi:acetyl esterase/lipase